MSVDHGATMRRNLSKWSDEKLEREIRRHPDELSLWNELFTRLQPRLFLKAKRVCNNSAAEAEDLVQEIFLVASRQLLNPKFSIHIEFRRDLDSRILSSKLRELFKSKKVMLSDSATISIRRKSYKWVITDGESQS